MAAEFVGSSVLVTLRSPPAALLQGTVLSIVGQQLTLANVIWIATGIYEDQQTIAASNILDLEVAPESNTHLTMDHCHKPSPASELSVPMASYISDPSEQGRPSPISSIRHLPLPMTMLDPAIVSFGRPDQMPVGAASILPPATHLPFSKAPPIPPHMLVEAARGSPTRSTPAIPIRVVAAPSSKPGTPLDRRHVKVVSLARATLTEPFDESLGSNGEEVEAPELAAELGIHDRKGETLRLEKEAKISGLGMEREQNGRRTRRGVKSKPLSNGTSREANHASTTHNAARGNPTRGQDSSQQRTPLVEADSFGITIPLQVPRTKRNGRANRLKPQEVQSGWATEDATDIQELGDFDFAGNLSKFDKREVFKQLKQDDKTAEASRLVSYNRLPRAGTAGGKNLHWTENVLDSPKSFETSKPMLPTNGLPKWTSEAGESEEMDHGDSSTSSSHSSHRNLSRLGRRRHAPSRKSSGKTIEAAGPRLVNTSFANLRQSSFSGSPAPRHHLVSSPFLGSSSQPSLRLVKSNHPCPSLSPLQMVELEQYAVSELGLSEDMMTENAARGIAETVFLNLDHFGARSLHLNPLIVVVAGNHKTGARAIAACRHLQNHGCRVVATVLGLEREEGLLDSVKAQCNAFQKPSGTLIRHMDLLDGLKSGSLRPTLFVDALFGIHTCFDDLRRDDQAWYFELVLWASREDPYILAVDVPSGIDPASGEFSTTAESASLVLLPAFILSLGAPKSWLLPAHQMSDLKPTTLLYVADIGISNLAWKRIGNRRSKGIDFGHAWVLEFRYSTLAD